MYNQKGFTLLEMLIVLSIWSVLILFTIPINLNTLEKQQEDKFFETLALDVLYIQNLSASSKGYLHPRINLHEDRYIMRAGTLDNEMIERRIPEGWRIDFRTLPLIEFDPNGRMKTPGNIIIKTKDTTYNVIFPFGKGRYHVVEQ